MTRLSFSFEVQQQECLINHLSVSHNHFHNFELPNSRNMTMQATRHFGNDVTNSPTKQLNSPIKQLNSPTKRLARNSFTKVLIKEEQALSAFEERETAIYGANVGKVINSSTKVLVTEEQALSAFEEREKAKSRAKADKAHKLKTNSIYKQKCAAEQCLAFVGRKNQHNNKSFKRWCVACRRKNAGA